MGVTGEWVKPGWGSRRVSDEVEPSRGRMKSCLTSGKDREIEKSFRVDSGLKVDGWGRLEQLCSSSPGARCDLVLL